MVRCKKRPAPDTHTDDIPNAPRAAAAFRVVLADGCPAYQPFLDFFLNMDTINDSEMNCVVSADGWVFYGNNAANTICTNMYCPRAGFTSFQYGGGHDPRGACGQRGDGGSEDGTHVGGGHDPRDEVHLTFRTIRDAMHLYRAILSRSEIGEVCISYCWGENGEELNTDFITIAAKRKTPAGAAASLPFPSPMTADVGSADRSALFLSADIALGALSETVAFVDVEKQVDLDQFTYQLALPSGSLEQSMKLVRKCYGDNVCSITVEPHAHTPSVSFHASDKVIMRNCTIPLNMADVRRHTLSEPDLERRRFYLHWRACSVIQQFCRIAPQVSLFMHTRQEYPGFLKFASETDADADADANGAPFMYVVFAWHLIDEDGEE